MRRFSIVVPYHDGHDHRAVSLSVHARHVLEALDAARRNLEAIRPLLGRRVRLHDGGPMVLTSPLV